MEQRGGWAIPVPSGVPVHEYPAVASRDRRGQRVGLVEDLVIGERGGDPNYSFYRAWSIALGGDGRIYVLDRGNHRVQVFAAQGEYERTIGRRGQGPGEFGTCYAIAMAGDRLFVSDFTNARLSVWELDGRHLADLRLGYTRALARMVGLATGSLVAAYVTRDPDQPTGPGRLVVAQISSTGHEVRRYAPGLPLDASAFRPDFAATAMGDVYVTGGGRYEVVAFAASGQMRWAIRVPWPESAPALAGIEVDGHGHLYVFPRVRAGAAAETDEVPVDVYGGDGERLYAGLIPARRWIVARGEYVYGIETDPATGGELVVRYRLSEPFGFSPKPGPRPGSPAPLRSSSSSLAPSRT